MNPIIDLYEIEGRIDCDLDRNGVPHPTPVKLSHSELAALVWMARKFMADWRETAAITGQRALFIGCYKIEDSQPLHVPALCPDCTSAPRGSEPCRTCNGDGVI